MTADLKDLSTRLAKIPCAVLSDVLRSAGVSHHALHHGVARLYQTQAMAGPVFCVRGQRVLGGGPKKPGNPRHEMFRRIAPGEILMIACDGYEDAVAIGENMVIALQEAGCAGIVTDGGLRDRDSIGTLGIPVYARFVTPLASGGAWAINEIEQPIQMRGQSSETVTVHPGDFIVADGDGVVVIPKAGAQSIAEDAEIFIQQEERHRQMILEGKDPGEVYKTVNRYAHVRPVS